MRISRNASFWLPQHLGRTMQGPTATSSLSYPMAIVSAIEIWTLYYKIQVNQAFSIGLKQKHKFLYDTALS